MAEGETGMAQSLHWGGCDTTALAGEYGTPLYVIDERAVMDRIGLYTSAAARAYPRTAIAYAGKAFLCGAMAQLVAGEGLWLDVVSGGELHLALAAGFPPGRLIFHGNNRDEQELQLGLEAGVARLVIDGQDEMDRLERLTTTVGVRPRVLLRITPGISPRTHRSIRTGQSDSKFGFAVATGDALKATRAVLESGRMELVGFHCHIGSAIRDLAPFRAAARAAASFAWDVWRETGYLAREVNLGGGWGIDGSGGPGAPSVSEYVEATLGAFSRAWRRHGEPGASPPGTASPGPSRYFWPVVMLEPGRSLVAEAGITLYTVGAVKHVPGHPAYVLVDGGMADNPRTALYRARYRACVATRMDEPPDGTYRLAGKACESGDIIIDGIDLPEPRVGDLVAVFETGAYNHSMSSNYNRLPRPPVVFVRDGSARLVVRREAFSDLEACDLSLGRDLPERTAAAGTNS